MKTFEERYTAWIDGKLEGPALTSFELELSRRASAGEARADKEDAARLHTLLTTHLQAPALTNPDFFNHQLCERIAAEQRADDRRHEEGRSTRRAWWPSFDWSLTKLGALAAGTAFVAVAVYYGMVPPHAGQTGTASVAVATPAATANPSQDVPVAVEAPSQELASKSMTTQDGGNQMAKNDALPTPIPVSSDLPKEGVFNAPANPTPASLQTTDPNASRLWINGLNYNSSAPGALPSGSTPPLPQSGESAPSLGQ